MDPKTYAAPFGDTQECLEDNIPTLVDNEPPRPFEDYPEDVWDEKTKADVVHDLS